MYFVYHISATHNLNDGYIGVTNNLERRWKYHSKSEYTIGRIIRNKGWTIENNMKIIFSGKEEDCYEMEILLRPKPLIGLNESAGGQGGNKYEYLSLISKKIRNQKISQKLKGRNHTWGDKISKTRKEKQMAKGSNNPRAVKWKLISPQKEKFYIIGGLQKFCDENKLLRSCLRRYVNLIVPNINQNGFGGYRAKNKISEELRKNTTGWTLYIMEK